MVRVGIVMPILILLFPNPKRLSNSRNVTRNPYSGNLKSGTSGDGKPRFYIVEMFLVVYKRSSAMAIHVAFLLCLMRC